MRIIFFTYQGHSSEVHSVCWDTNGDYLASVSRDSVRVWSIASGECIHELSSSGNMFNSCVFHPSYSSLLVLGGYQVIHCLKLSLFHHYLALVYLLLPVIPSHALRAYHLGVYLWLNWLWFCHVNIIFKPIIFIVRTVSVKMKYIRIFVRK